MWWFGGCLYELPYKSVSMTAWRASSKHLSSMLLGRCSHPRRSMCLELDEPRDR
jgi:hypothetical protein